MKADTIRMLEPDGMNQTTNRLLREIAAQLAELNETLKKVGNVIAIVGDRSDPR